MRTCPLGPAPESSLSRRPASRPVLVCPGPHRCAHDPVSAYFSFSLRVSVSLRPSKPLYLCLPVSRPPTFNPLHPPSNPGVSLLSATPSGVSLLSLAGSLCSFSRLSVLFAGSLCSFSWVSVFFPWVSLCSSRLSALSSLVSLLPPPSLGLPSRVSVGSLAGLLVSLSPTDWNLCRPFAETQTSSSFLWNAAPLVLPPQGGGWG